MTKEIQKRKRYPMDVNNYGAKVPPNASDVEEILLGSILLDDSAMRRMSHCISPSDFYKIEHQYIYSAMLSLHSSSKPIDVVTVTVELKKAGKLESVGGAYYVSQLTDRVGSADNAEAHASIIREMSVKREQIALAVHVMDMAYDDASDVMDTNDEISIGAQKLSSMLSTSPVESISKQVSKVLQEAEMMSKDGVILGMTTGIRDLDRMTGGREGGQLIIVAARPAMGKSAYALCQAIHQSVSLSKKVLFYSLEMTSTALVRRGISTESEINSNLIKSGQLTKEQWDMINVSASRIANSRLTIIDNMFGLNEILAHSRKSHEESPLSAIYIDYLQIIKHSLNGRNREQEISEISRSLKLLAKTLNVPVIALSQLSRALESRGGTKRPMLSDLRESGSIEQDADIVEFIYRPAYYGIELDGINDPIDAAQSAISIIAKNREGATGDVSMRFVPELTKFMNWEDRPKRTETVQQLSEIPSRSTAMRPSEEFDVRKPYADSDFEEDVF